MFAAVVDGWERGTDSIDLKGILPPAAASAPGPSHQSQSVTAKPTITTPSCKPLESNAATPSAEPTPLRASTCA